jgi:hypothetical protein
LLPTKETATLNSSSGSFTSGGGVHSTEERWSGGVALVGGLLEPLCSLSTVLRHTLAVPIQNPEHMLSARVALVGSLLELLCGLSFVPRHTFALVIHKREQGLSIGVSLIGSLS